MAICSSTFCSASLLPTISLEIVLECRLFRFEVKPFLFVGRNTLPDGIQQFFVVERLRQEIRRACFEGAHCHWDVAVAGEEYDGDLITRFGELLLQVESA